MTINKKKFKGRENANSVLYWFGHTLVPMSSPQATRLRVPLSCKIPFTMTEKHKDNPSFVFR